MNMPWALYSLGIIGLTGLIYINTGSLFSLVLLTLTLVVRD